MSFASLKSTYNSNLMRKSLLIAFVIGFIAVPTFAQQIQWSSPKLSAERTEVDTERKIIKERNANREVLWSEDFSNGLNSDNGEWTTEGDNLWEYTTAVANGCWSGSADNAVQFTTKNNGFMIFHADEANCIDPNPDPPIENENVYQGALISPSIDLSGVSAALVSFEHLFRYCCDDDFELWFSVSVDGGDNWTDIDVTSGTPVGEYNEQPLTNLNISQLVANESDVRFKFLWNATNTASHYFWALDDVSVEIPVDHDIVLLDYNYQQFDPSTATDFTDVKYSIYQVDQVRPLNLQAMAVNKGAQDQPNVVLIANVSTPSGPVVLSTAPQSISVGDTAIFEIPYTPENEVGEYEITYEMVLENPDEFPEDNSGSTSFLVDDNFFARDDRSRDGAFNNYIDDLTTALAYTLTADGTIYGIGIALDESSDIGASFHAELIDNNSVTIAQTATTLVQEEMLNGPGDENIVQLLLDAPVSGTAGSSYYPAFVFSGGENAANIALSGYCPDISCWVWATTASSGEVCNPCHYNSTPMIRLLFAEDVSLHDVAPQNGITLGQNVPNPAKENTVVAFELQQLTHDVVLEVRDFSGRIMQQKNLGTLPIGTHTEQFNVDQYSSGVYFYSLYANGDRQTKRLAVIK